MQTCRTCRHLGPDNWMYAPAGWHSCTAMARNTDPNVVPAGTLAHVDPARVTEEGAELFVSPKFGCVMHEPDAEAVQEDDGA